MQADTFNSTIILILTVGFAYACLLGYFSHKIKLSPLLGYMVAGFLIGPYSPGYIINAEIAEGLAELGIVLMMFGVGLHFKLADLLSVKYIAIPGAIVQTFVASTSGMLLLYAMGWKIESGIIMGLSIGVASTIVLVRQLANNDLLSTLEGHISVGWLIVEDLITVIVLLVIPEIGKGFQQGDFSYIGLGQSIAFVILQFILLIFLMTTIGMRVVRYSFIKIVQTRDSELFTLCILAVTLVIAGIASRLFGTSLALGAFIAGMMIGQTNVRKQATLNALPIRDLFAVIFFLSIGMIFNPYQVMNHYFIFFGVLLIILIIKPLTAYLIVILFGHSHYIAATVAIALAQIGEFSFILAKMGSIYKIFPNEGDDIVVAAAIVSIAINPLLFKLVHKDRIYDKSIEIS